MKKIIAAAVAGAVLLTALPAFASDINITIDGEIFTAKNEHGETVKPFIENGSTFLPVRAMGNAVEKEVAFDAENYAVYIGTRPMAEEVNKEPLLVVDGRVFYRDDVDTIGGIELVKQTAKIIKFAESKFDEEALKSKFEELCEMYADIYASYDADKKDLLDYIVYHDACVELIFDNDVSDMEIYGKFATVKHILVTKKEDAVKIIEELDRGEAIEDLIEEYDEDPGQTRDSSYTFTYGEMVAEFEKAAFELSEGEYTKVPVRSDYGYHIILRLPLDGDGISVESRSRVYADMINKVELDGVIEVKPEGEYGKIGDRVYTAKDLEMVYALIAGESESIDCREAFEYATIMSVINAIARERGIIGDESADDFWLDYEMAYFTQLYNAMLEGSFEIAEDEFERIYDSIETTVFRRIKVFVDGKLIVPCDVNNNYVEPKNVEGTVYVPVRAIVEALGMKAGWDNDTRTVVITK